MEDLRVSPVGVPALQGKAPIRPVQLNASSMASTLSTQGLAQDHFQQNLNQAALTPAVTPANTSPDSSQGAADSLLTSLRVPQATAIATPTLTVLGDALAPQSTRDALSASDLALQTALRFGAGVVGTGTPALTLPVQGTALVRDASPVMRIGNLQPQTGNPSPDAFQRSQEAQNRVPRPYLASPPTPPTPGLDLMA